MLLFISPSSHGDDGEHGFQYIPCYCLSPLIPHFFVVVPLFQYIPCYCLSLVGLSIPLNIIAISIHPMLLFIEVTAQTMSRSSYNFNTSHVTVYHFAFIILPFCIEISIHPMLLFISVSSLQCHNITPISIHPMLRFIMQEATMKALLKIFIFQYIPCYCLSLRRTGSF